MAHRRYDQPIKNIHVRIYITFLPWLLNIKKLEAEKSASYPNKICRVVELFGGVSDNCVANWYVTCIPGRCCCKSILFIWPQTEQWWKPAFKKLSLQILFFYILNTVFSLFPPIITVSTSESCNHPHQLWPSFVL